MKCEDVCKVWLKSAGRDRTLEKVGPFMVVSKLRKCHILLLEYVFAEQRDEREVVVATDLFSVTREDMKSLCMNSMNRSVSKKIVDVAVELMMQEERNIRGGNAKYWWIPTYLSKPLDDENWCGEDRPAWQSWVSNLAEVEKIYFPLKLGKCWLVAIVDVKVGNVIVPKLAKGISVQDCIAIVDNLLRTLDVIFEEEIKEVKPFGWTFKGFEVVKDNECQKEVDDQGSGLYVVRVMQSAFNDGCVCNHGSLDDEASMLALQLLTSDWNKLRFKMSLHATTTAKP